MKKIILLGLLVVLLSLNCFAISRGYVLALSPSFGGIYFDNLKTAEARAPWLASVFCSMNGTCGDISITYFVFSANGKLILIK